MDKQWGGELGIMGNPNKGLFRDRRTKRLLCLCPLRYFNCGE